MRKLKLIHTRSPGDVLVMTSLIRDIYKTCPDEFHISVHTSASQLWVFNPYIKSLTPEYQELRIGYGDSINSVGRRNYHFLTGFHADFEKLTGKHIPLLYPRPDLHFGKNEESPIVAGRYWVIVSGGKTDFITKHWIYKRWQQVVNILRNKGIYCVQVGSLSSSKELKHFHPRLENTLCLLGLTDLRDLARIVRDADGVMCPITLHMHMAAALQKPCVVVGGGREEWWWEAYVAGRGNFGGELLEDVKVDHRYIHTMDKLDCCMSRGCWKNTVIQSDENALRTCKYPVNIGGQYVPECMNLIGVEDVVAAVDSYYADGTLPPPSGPEPSLSAPTNTMQLQNQLSEISNQNPS